MTRNIKPFTSSQLALIKALSEFIKQINDPDGDVIIGHTVEWQIKNYGSGLGGLPVPIFSPSAIVIKQNLLMSAGIMNEDRERQIAAIRDKYKLQKARYALAKLFDSHWKSLMFKAKKAVIITAYLNFHLTLPSFQLAEPITMLQEIVMQEQAGKFK